MEVCHHIFSSSSSHLHIFSFSHLYIFIFTSSHLPIFTSSYVHIFSSSHLHIFSSSLSGPLALLPSCFLALFSLLLISLLRRGAVPTRRHEMQPFRTKWGSIVKNYSEMAILKCRSRLFRTKWGSIVKRWGAIAVLSGVALPSVSKSFLCVNMSVCQALCVKALCVKALVCKRRLCVKRFLCKSVCVYDCLCLCLKASVCKWACVYECFCSQECLSEGFF